MSMAHLLCILNSFPVLHAERTRKLVETLFTDIFKPFFRFLSICMSTTFKEQLKTQLFQTFLNVFLIQWKPFKKKKKGLKRLKKSVSTSFRVHTAPKNWSKYTSHTNSTTNAFPFWEGGNKMDEINFSFLIWSVFSCFLYFFCQDCLWEHVQTEFGYNNPQ